jgi:hypothetical protein
MIAAPGCTCWMETMPCARHGIEPREYHECAKPPDRPAFGGVPVRRAGAVADCLLCSSAAVDAALADPPAEEDVSP